MRIVHLPSSYLPQSVGGTERYVHRLSDGLGRKGHEVIVAYHDGGGRGVPAVSAHYRVAALGALRAPSRRELYSVATGEPPPDFESLVRRFSPDVIHFHSFTLGAGIDHARVAVACGIPYVLTYHVPAVTCPRGTLVKFGREVCNGLMDERDCAPCMLESQGVPASVALVLGRSNLSADSLPDRWWTVKLASKDLVRRHHRTSRDFLAGAAHVVACADWSRQVLVRNGLHADRISVHRQAMPGRTRERRLRLPVEKGRTIRLGFLGRFVPDKGPDLLLQAIPYLRAQGLKVECELSGPMSDRHESWARKLLSTCPSEAHYLGVVPDEDLNRWLSSLDLLVVPSRWMELGTYTLLEAWDNGTPVIGANLGGIPEFLNPEGLSELLFELNNPRSLAGAVMRAVDWKSAAPRVSIPGVEELSDAMIAMYSNVCGRMKRSATPSSLLPA